MPGHRIGYVRGDDSDSRERVALRGESCCRSDRKD